MITNLWQETQYHPPFSKNKQHYPPFNKNKQHYPPFNKKNKNNIHPSGRTNNDIYPLTRINNAIHSSTRKTLSSTLQQRNQKHSLFNNEYIIHPISSYQHHQHFNNKTNHIHPSTRKTSSSTLQQWKHHPPYWVVQVRLLTPLTLPGIA